MGQERKDKLDRAYLVVDSVLKSIASFRAIKENLKIVLLDLHDGQAFEIWQNLSNTIYDSIIMRFLQLFYSPKNLNLPKDVVYWREIIEENEQDKWYSDLLSNIGITKQEWNDYIIDTLKEYRNAWVVHNTIDHEYWKNKDHPVFQIALEACFFYYEYVMDLYGYEINAKEEYEKIEGNSFRVLKAAIEASIIKS
jgi:hypothetical protein